VVREFVMRKWLIGSSLVVHFALIFGLFVTGMWKLDRLEAGRRSIDLRQIPSPPEAAASGGETRKTPEFNKKKPRVVHETVQPPEHKPAQTETSTTTTDEPGTGSGSGSGSGSGEITDGKCVVDCGEGSGQEQPKEKEAVKEPPKLIPPVVLRELRISGETQIQPPDVVKTQIMRDGGGKIIGSFKVCLDASGLVSSIALSKPTGYAGYDAELSRAMRDWRYRPYTRDGHSIPVCGIVTFIYSMK